jgi:hypothetical protein
MKKRLVFKINLWILFFFCLRHGFAQSTQLPLLNDFDHVSTNAVNKTFNNNQNTGSGGIEGPPAKVRIGYVVPSNRTPQANYKENLQFAIEMAQMWFRDNMQQNGFGLKTLLL